MILSEHTTVVFEAQVVAPAEARPNVRINVALVIVVVATEVTLEACISVYEIVVMRVIKRGSVIVVYGLLTVVICEHKIVMDISELRKHRWFWGVQADVRDIRSPIPTVKGPYVD